MRVNISMDQRTRDVLDALRGDTPASAYLAHLLDTQEARLRDAFDHLAAAGWASTEARVALACLNGTWLMGEAYQSPGALAMELHDAARLRKTHSEHGISGERWAEMVTQLRGSPLLARALATMAIEWWQTQGGRVEQLIDRLDRA